MTRSPRAADFLAKDLAPSCSEMVRTSKLLVRTCTGLVSMRMHRMASNHRRSRSVTRCNSGDDGPADLCLPSCYFCCCCLRTEGPRSICRCCSYGCEYRSLTHMRHKRWYRLFNRAFAWTVRKRLRLPLRFLLSHALTIEQWEPHDYAIYAAKQYGLRVVLPLTDNHR